MKKLFKKYFFLRKNLYKEINKEREEERKLAEKEHKKKVKELEADFESRIDILESSKNAEIRRLKTRISVLEGEKRDVNMLRQDSLRLIGEACNIVGELKYHHEENTNLMAKTYTIFYDLEERADKAQKEATKRLEMLD